MANVTDPLAAAVHGTDPQNLMEYITRQKIYDCRYWKEECFGLTAVDVLEKASKLKCIGASYGGNATPTRFLCLVLKLLQIQPAQESLDEFIDNEDFKYVRLLGAFMKRLTGRPADIYEKLEPLYVDYRKVRYRAMTEWNLLRVDEMVHSLLRDDRVCGIALPRLPVRKLLVEEGYLDEDYVSPLEKAIGSDMTLKQYLRQKVEDGSAQAKQLWEERETKLKAKVTLQRKREKAIEAAKEKKRPNQRVGNAYYGRSDGRGRSDFKEDYHTPQQDYDTKRSKRNSDDQKKHEEERRARKESKKRKEKDYGTLFKSKKKSNKGAGDESDQQQQQQQPEENSAEYWNEQRAKLGMKPLKE